VLRNLDALSGRPVDIAVEFAPVEAKLAVDTHAGNIHASLVTQRVLGHTEIFGRVLDVHQPLLHPSHALKFASYGIGDRLDEQIAGCGCLLLILRSARFERRLHFLSLPRTPSIGYDIFSANASIQRSQVSYS
jgi:hypothetical protein